MTRTDGRQLRWVTLLLALGLVVGLLGLAAPPSAAKDGLADNRARYSACVDIATEPAGFLDMDGNFAEEAANCLAYYGITKGTSADMFSPGALITRSQMALFLARAARPAGIVLRAASDQGFEDIDGLSQEARDAVNRMVGLGIMDGPSRVAFDPSGMVTRMDMAVYLEAFLEEAEVGPGGTPIDALDADDKVFDDIDDPPFYVYDAIRNLYELGVTTGKSPKKFAPEEDLTRGQMAVFIVRMLAHTNARPIGVSVQADISEVFGGGEIEIAVSLRDGSYRPLEDEYVDVFTATDESRAFNQNGVCTRRAHRVSGSDACRIDRRDQTTDPQGNLRIPLEPTGNEIVVWAWTGDRNDDFRLGRSAEAEVYAGPVKPVAGMVVTDDMNPGAEFIRFGESVTFTLQLIDADSDPVAHEGWEVTISTVEVDSNRKRTRSREEHQTDPSGRITLTYHQDDTASARSNTATLDFDVSRQGLDEIEDKTTLLVVRNDFVEDDEDDPARDEKVQWSDEEERATNLVLSQTRAYHEASNRGVANTVRATLADQYGEPIPGVRILFYSNDSKGLRDRSGSRTDSRGVASITYERDSDNDNIERIRARTDDRYIDISTRRDLRHYWGHSVDEDTDAQGRGEVKVVDTANDTAVVVEGGDVRIVTWDSNDRFYHEREPVDIDVFEDRIEVNDLLDYEYDEDSSIESFELV